MTPCCHSQASNEMFNTRTQLALIPVFRQINSPENKLLKSGSRTEYKTASRFFLRIKTLDRIWLELFMFAIDAQPARILGKSITPRTDHQHLVIMADVL